MNMYMPGWKSFKVSCPVTTIVLGEAYAVPMSPNSFNLMYFWLLQSTGLPITPLN